MSSSESDHPLDPRLLQAIAAGTASEIGAPFFDRLARHLAQGLGTRCAWVTEWLPDERRLRALSFWDRDHYVTGFEYDVAGTPCGAVVEGGRFVHVPDRVIQLYPSDPDLPPLDAVSYMGIALFDSDGTLLGHLAVLHDAPMGEDPRARAVFEIFAGRAAAELRRLRRDAALREREEKLSRLVDGAMDAIVELDDALAIGGLNRAAERLLQAGAAEWLGRPVASLLGDADHRELGRLTRELAAPDAERSSLWIPDRFEVRRADGKTVSVEGTLSRYEAGGRRFFALIVRNLEERLEADALRAELASLRGFGEIVGESLALRGLLRDVERVAASPTTVLITGETGTGKELVARAVHERSPRAERPLVTVNCAAIPENLQESELFGHERGAFTGATSRRAGRFQRADGGTLFLDEVGELPLDLQAKLLRVLQEGEVEPVGGQRSVRVDVRVIAATHRDLSAMVKAGRFREDLFYRLNVFPLRVPPLRERGGDVVRLAEHFARSFAESLGRTVAPLGESERARLSSYDWPGNVRELQNVIERALLTSVDGRHLNLDRALPEPASVAAPAPAEPSPEPDRILTDAELRDRERANLVRALAASGGKVSGPGGAAQRLGLRPSTLSSRMKALGVRPGRPSS